MNRAYLNGFVKRAAEYGFNEEEIAKLAEQAMDRNVYDLEEQKAGLLSNMLASATLGAIPPDRQGGEFGGSIPLAYNAYSDLAAPKGMPSRLANISGGTFLGDVLGGAAGYGLGRLAGHSNLDEDLSSGRLLGRVVGSGLGARAYNQKIDDLINETRQAQGW